MIGEILTWRCVSLGLCVDNCSNSAEAHPFACMHMLEYTCAPPPLVGLGGVAADPCCQLSML